MSTNIPKDNDINNTFIDEITDNYQYDIDITIDKEFLILQYKTYPKYYIVRRIQENEFFYNDIIKDDIVCYRFRLKTNDQKADFSIMQTNGTQFCTKEFILSMAILWKDYLDSSFYDTIF